MRLFRGHFLKSGALLLLFLAGVCCRVALTSQFYGTINSLTSSKAHAGFVASGEGNGLDKLLAAKIMKAKRRFDDDLRLATEPTEADRVFVPCVQPTLRHLLARFAVNSGYIDPSLRPPC